MRFHYVSDIHLEMENEKNRPEFSKLIGCSGGENLVLAGDIGQVGVGRFEEFIEWCCERWNRVFYVTGNHEYYLGLHSKMTMQDIDTAIENQTKKTTNFFYLRGTECIDIPNTDISVVGCTLWTEIPDELLSESKFTMNDYNYILIDETRSLLPLDSRALHRNQRCLLEKQIRAAVARDRRVVVVTHHMPSYELIGKQWKGCKMNCCFASNCDDLIGIKGVIAWFYGHTHMRGSKKIGGVDCLVNAIGYPGNERSRWGEAREVFWDST